MSQPADILCCSRATFLIAVESLPQLIAKHPSNQSLPTPSQWGMGENRKNKSKKTHGLKQRLGNRLRSTLAGKTDLTWGTEQIFCSLG